tara:strand:- start:1493 stop:2761 length:1269 start_codon:yes stop_codon:yes gene_type:complete
MQNMKDGAIATLKECTIIADIAKSRLEEVKNLQLDIVGDEDREFRTYSKAEAQSWLGVKHATKLSRAIKELESSPKPVRFEREANGHYKFTIQDLHTLADAMDIPKFKRKPNDKCQVICVSALKGGAAKTTTAVNVASGLAVNNNKRYRVAVIDLDPQGTGTMFGVPNLTDDDFTVGDILQGNFDLDEGESEKDFVKSCFKNTSIPNLDYLPARVSDFFFESVAEQIKIDEYDQPNSDKNRTYRLLKERIIDAVSDDYDIIILDTAPALNTTFYNAIYASTSLLIPVIPELVSLDATLKYLERLKDIYAIAAKAGHEGMDFIRMLVTNFDDSGNKTHITVHRTYKTDLQTIFSNRVLAYPLKHSAAIPICADNYMTVFEMNPKEYPKSRAKLLDCVSNLSEVVNEVEVLCCQAWPSIRTNMR